MQMRTWRYTAAAGLCLLAISLLGACSRGPDDATLTSSVKSKLTTELPAAAVSINVDTKDGTVTLSGTVDSDASKIKAEQTAMSVTGVQSVTNNLTVKPPAPVMTVADDAAIKSAVEANLTKYGVKGLTVEVAAGEVTLKGDIQRARLQDAMKAANEAKPKKVNNQMNIK
jgi:osmotically-inducible protein OsmY